MNLIHQSDKIYYMYNYIYKTPKQFSNILLTSDGEFLTGLYFIDTVNKSNNIIHQSFTETIKWLDIYFNGDIPNYTPKYKLNSLTPFQKEVLEITKNIPYGKISTYKEIADTIAKRKNIKKMSAQAVGQALKHNPICIIIPCHRVIGSNNKLTGYNGGINNKIELLKLEK